jgi:AAA+ superfamily predicted ATPase
MNHAKNATKHMSETDDDHVHFNARTEAHDMLDRAVSNYYQAMTEYELPETEAIRRFNQELASGA